MNTPSYITLVIHTKARAFSLKAALEAHHIGVKLLGVRSEYSRKDIGVRVQVRESDLPLALNIMESGDSPSTSASKLRRVEGFSDSLLIPVDFSAGSIVACKVGFALAERLSLKPLLLHAYMTPVFTLGPQAADAGAVSVAPDPLEMEEDMEVSKQTEKSMTSLAAKLKKLQEGGQLTDVDFTTSLEEGVAEDVILEYCREYKPQLVVMATRGRERKEEELIGSVTAEVLDSCRVPVFAVPDDYSFTGLEDIDRLMLFCNLDRHDVVTVDNLMTMFEFPEVKVTLVPAQERHGLPHAERLRMLREYLGQRYPMATFQTETVDPKSYRSELDTLIRQQDVQMLIVPNKKTNIFSRIFKPTLAHKFLFERDMPILALPV